jgi:two-component system cell cycle sensor histidine kinase/response regulator CckA
MDATALKLRALAPSFAAAASDAFLDARFRKSFEATTIGIGICDLEGRVVEANSALARLFGYEREGLVGIDPWRPGGGKSDPGDMANPSYALGIDELLRLEDQPFVLERRFERRDGSEFWGRPRAFVARDDGGQPAFLVMVLEDASERRRMEEQLRQAEKMAAIGQLAGGVAHDFNNLLTGILLYCDLLIPELELGGPLHRYVEEIRLATEQGAALSQQLLALARKEGLQTRVTDVNEVALGMENFLKRLMGEQIALIAMCDAAPGTVVADPAQLRQILLNLVLNGRDALGRERVLGGKIRVSTRVAEWPAGLGKRRAPLRADKKNPAQGEPGRAGTHGRRSHGGDIRSVSMPRPGVDNQRPFAVLLTVEDNGCGMSAETCAHLFEPFFTTKAAGSGTGIGLGTVQRIVGELGGAIEIASAPGSGTRVEVFLPLAGSRKGQASQPGLASGLPRTIPTSEVFDTHVPKSKIEVKKGGSQC